MWQKQRDWGDKLGAARTEMLNNCCVANKLQSVNSWATLCVRRSGGFLMQI